MPQQPPQTNGANISYTIKVGGTPIPASYTIQSISIEKKANSIASARIVVLDGDPGTMDFNVSSSATFVPGGLITIELGYSRASALVFSGIITGQSLRIDAAIGSVLEVVCYDQTIKMTVGRKNATFSGKKDNDIISSVISNAGLTANVAATTVAMPQQVQYYVTDWDFILSLAQANGLIITTINGTVDVINPEANTTSLLLVSFGDSLLEFNADLDAVNQLAGTTASAWNYKTQAIEEKKSASGIAGPGNISSDQLSRVIGLSDYKLQSTAPLGSEALTAWANAALEKSEFAKILGTAKIRGSSLAEPGTYITLAGLGSRFSGDHFISGVVHEVAGGNWFTTVSIGIPLSSPLQQPSVIAPSASGLVPGVHGLLNGTVKQMYNDPDGQYRILVDVPMFGTGSAGIWARVSNFYATGGGGAFFLPEVGDEVVLGFLNEDPRYPVILGSMYSNAAKAPASKLVPSQANSLKAIVSQSGITLQFDDENKVLTLTTPGSNTVTLSDKDQQVVIRDQNNNSITMAKEGITISSAGDITISAGKKIKISGDQGAAISSSGGDVTVDAINIKESAQLQYSAEGTATATIVASGELTLKGAMIMIN